MLQVISQCEEQSDFQPVLHLSGVCRGMSENPVISLLSLTARSRDIYWRKVVNTALLFSSLVL